MTSPCYALLCELFSEAIETRPRRSSDAVLHMSWIICYWGKTKDFSHLHSIRLMWSTASQWTWPKTSNTEGVIHHKPLSYPRDIWPALDLAVQLSHHVLSFGSDLRPYQTETHHVLSKTEHLSWKRAISWPTQNQQKPQLRLREICFPQGHPRRRVRQRQHYIYQGLCGKRWNEWALSFLQWKKVTFLRYSMTLAQGHLGLFG